MNARTRAAEWLDVPADASSERATAAFLGALPATDFVPPQTRLLALNELAGTELATEADADPGLRDDIEAFAGDYWSLAPVERRAEWVALTRALPRRIARAASAAPGKGAGHGRRRARSRKLLDTECRFRRFFESRRSSGPDRRDGPWMQNFRAYR